MMHNCTCRTDHIPDKESVREDTDGDLYQALYKERHVFLAYFTSFVVIGKYLLIIVCIYVYIYMYIYKRGIKYTV